jgi:RNA polymerase sigma factor (sigma-70 family)
VFSGIVAESAILPAGAESTVLGLPMPLPTRAAQWDKEQVLVRVYNVARRYTRAHGGRDVAEDVAADVVVYLLSNPSEMTRLRERGPQPDDFARILASRRLMTIRHGRLAEALGSEVEVELPVVEEEEGSDEDFEVMHILGKYLSEKALRMLVARYVEEQSVNEIAESENLTQVEVVRQLNKARELARRFLHPL